MSDEAISELIAKIEQADDVTWLNIRSGGGDVEFGIRLGYFIFKRGLNIRVVDYCMSSCANYVFTAGILKEIGNTASIGYHGGAGDVAISNNDIDQMIANLPEAQKGIVRKQIAEQFEQKVTKQKTFFEYIGVDESIVNFALSTLETQANDEVWGWYYKIEDLPKFGIENVRVVDPPWSYLELDSKKRLFMANTSN